MTRHDLVVDALRRPQDTPQLALSGWDLLIRQARRADLLGRLALLIERADVADQVPAGPRAQLQAAKQLNQAQHLEVRRELAHLALALAPLQLQPVLLKGAAYLAAGEAAALGRAFDDVDLLVPRDRLPEVESHLMMGGWASSQHSTYDQRYYRDWMHELPPMQHSSRHAVVDVHHAILPLTARLKPDSGQLLAQARDVPDMPAWRVLAPPDMVLHSMTHLFHNEELSHGLRDLSDLDLLLRQHGGEPGFWATLQTRAERLDLSRPLHYGLQQTSAILGTPVPAEALRAAAAHAAAWPLDRMMGRLWGAALRSPHASADLALSGLARGALFVRAHALRMPASLLLRHLARKAWRRHVLREAGA